MTEPEILERIWMRLEQQAPKLIAALQLFLERPGAQTFYDSEKRVHELLRVFGDAIVGDALSDFLIDEKVKAAVMDDVSKKNSPSTIRIATLRSNSVEEPPSRSRQSTAFHKDTDAPRRAASVNRDGEVRPGREIIPY